MSCSRLSLTRVLFALAGTMTLLGVFVAVNQWLFALVGACPASAVLGRTPCFRGEASA